MLRMKTNEEIQKVRYVNFKSSLKVDLKRYKMEFRDLLTKKEVEMNAFYADPKTLDAESAIFLLQELQWHLQRVLLKEKPDASHLELGCVWKQRCRQTEVLIASVKRRLSDLLWEVFQQNWPGEAGDMMEQYPCLCLPTPDDQILYWYANDCFAQNMDEEMIHQVRLKLEYQMIDWLDELDEMSEEDESVESTAFYQLQKYRCDEKQMQIEQLDRMAGVGVARRKKQGKENPCDDLPIGINWDQAPQWLGRTELIEEIEKIMLCMEHSESFPDGLVTRVQEKHNELLDELNRRMVAIVCSCIGCEESEQRVLEHTAQLGDIPYPVCFLEGAALEWPEDVICCWYLNERFPYKMGLEQLNCVEAALKRQREALAEMYEVYHNDGERGLWMLSMKLKNRQLKQIQEEIYAAEAALVYWDQKNDLLDQILLCE